MKYLILYPIIALIGLLIFAVLNLVYRFIRICALMLWDLDKAYENEVLKKTKDYREFEKRIDNLEI